MIQITEEPYDSEVAVGLVKALHADINDRYAHAMADWTEEERAADDEGYLAEVNPALVTPPIGVFLVAWLDGDPVGCGALKPFDRDGGVGEVKRMYTAPTARRRGVSKAVLRSLEQHARSYGYHRVQLETGTAQPEALALYESEGWHRIEPYGRYKDEPDSVCFAKDL